MPALRLLSKLGVVVVDQVRPFRIPASRKFECVDVCGLVGLAAQCQWDDGSRFCGCRPHFFLSSSLVLMNVTVRELCSSEDCSAGLCPGGREGGRLHFASIPYQIQAWPSLALRGAAWPAS